MMQNGVADSSRAISSQFTELVTETAVALLTIAHSLKNAGARIRDKVSFMPVSPRRKHIHHWYKSLAGGFRCDCEAWRCEFDGGIQQCEIASERGRKYCLTHRASRPTSVMAIRKSRTLTTLAKS